MIPMLNTKIVSVTPPAAIVDNAAFTTAEVDTLGYDFASFYVYYGATDIATAVLQVTETDTSGSGQVAITGTIFGTSTNTAGTTSTLPSATADNLFFAIHIDMRKGRKRYLDLNLTGGDGAAGTFAAVFCILSRGKELPNSASERGCSQDFIV